MGQDPISPPVPESAQRCWELGPLLPRWKDALLIAVMGGVWLLIEGLLALNIHTASDYFDFDWPTGWRAVPLCGLPLVGWTAFGVRFVVLVRRSVRGNVVVRASSEGIRVEQLTGRGRPVLADLAWR